jgi:hypothetical protein
VPPVPGDIQVPAGNVPFLKGHAVGTQTTCVFLSDPLMRGLRSGRRQRYLLLSHGINLNRSQHTFSVSTQEMDSFVRHGKVHSTRVPSGAPRQLHPAIPGSFNRERFRGYCCEPPVCKTDRRGEL